MQRKNTNSNIKQALQRNENSNPLHFLEKEVKPNVQERIFRLGYDDFCLAIKELSEGEQSSDTDNIIKYSAERLEKSLNFSDDTTIQEELLYASATAYYLSGNYARAYVLLKKAQPNISNNGKGLMILFLLRSLKEIRESTTLGLRENNALDEQLAQQLKSGRLGQDEAIRAIIKHILYKSFYLLTTYIEAGHVSLINKAIDILDSAIELAISSEMQDEWWLLSTLKFVFKEFHQNSLWNQLNEMIESDKWGLVSRYIRNHSIYELWRSQTQAVATINDAARTNIALDMPTSSGKTLVAELTILRFLVDHWETTKKCIYVAPFRALAAQVEVSLKTNIAKALNIRVSELYGGFDINPAELTLMFDTKVLIATPEKLDALIRYKSSFVEEIGLIVFDEGHIIEGGHRGLKYELFLHRVTRRLTKQGCRLLFASAVMPNINQIAKILSAKTIKTSWKPTELRVGVFEWNKSSGFRAYMYRGLKEEHQRDRANEPFVNSQESFTSKQKSEIAAVVGVAFAEKGTTLVYSALPNNVEKIAHFALEEIKRRTAIYQNSGLDRVFNLPLSTDPQNLIRLGECIQLSISIVGKDSIVTRALEKGIVVHHGGIPKKLRAQLEILMQSGMFSLIIGNYTLAQGVNLPVKTILIHQLHHRIKASPSDFWNICGRAGRAMEENNGEIFLLAYEDDASKKDVSKKRGLISQYMARVHSDALKSSLLQFLVSLKEAWEIAHPEASIPELCQQLADNDVEDWLTDRDLRQGLDILDTEILAILVEELASTDFTPSSVQELFEKSLMTIQLQEDEGRKITKELALAFLTSRQKWIERISDKDRNRYYRTGLTLSDCRKLSVMQESAREKLRHAVTFMQWEYIQRVEYLLEICKQFLFELNEIKTKASRDWLDCWSEIVKHWLLGKSEQEIANLPLVKFTTENLGSEAVMRVSQEIYDLCDYRFPWAFDALINFFDIDNGIGTEQQRAFPDVVRYFSSMMRYGVPSPVAATLCMHGLSRSASIALSEKYQGVLNPSDILNWISYHRIEEIERWNLELAVEQEIKKYVSRRRATIPSFNGLLPENYKWVLDISGKNCIAPLHPGIQLVAECAQSNSVDLFSPAFEHLGTIFINNLYVFEQLKQGYLKIESDELIDAVNKKELKIILATN